MKRLLVGFLVAWLVFDRVASLTASHYGGAGLLVGAVAVATLVAVEMWRARSGLGPTLQRLGFGRPAGRALLAAAAVGALMALYFPVFAAVVGAPLGLRPGWALLWPGLFAQGGIAEEAVFRGYLYGWLRQTRTFWRAAALSVPPFVAVHLLLFTYMPPAVATAATLLSLVMSFPLARAYDLGAATIWAPAVLHFVAQAAVKLVVLPEVHQMPMAMGWMLVSAALPWLVFLVPVRARQPA
jgi:membrane protease YdiL (CAAX protease family)